MKSVDARIDKLAARAFTLPTDAPEADGTLEWSSTTIIVVELGAGRETGLGYTYSNPVTAKLIDQTFREHIEGGDAMDTEGITQSVRAASRNLGAVGLVAHAISAINSALWDLKARLLKVSLADLLGCCRQSVPVYGSGGFTSYSLEQLTEQLAGWVSNGISRVKMKIGRQPHEDIKRVSAAREAIGPEAELFVDANGAYSRKQALQMANEFAQHRVSWFEEPVSSDDLEGLRLIRDRAPSGMNITAGEYGYRLVEFQRLLAAQAVDVLMADATRCGGMSAFRAAGSLCTGYQLPISAHTAPNLHLHVCAAMPQVQHIEYFHDHARIEQIFFDGALSPIKGELCPDRSRAGMGLILKEADIRRFQVQ